MAVMKGWRFPVRIDKNTGKIGTVEDNENVKQNVRIILSTQKFERKTIPNFGIDLTSFMFEIVDPSFVSLLKGMLEGAIKNWEKHAVDVKVTVNATRGPISKVETNIFYVTDIAPTQEKIVYDLNTNGK